MGALSFAALWTPVMDARSLQAAMVAMPKTARRVLRKRMELPPSGAFARRLDWRGARWCCAR